MPKLEQCVQFTHQLKCIKIMNIFIIINSYVFCKPATWIFNCTALSIFFANQLQKCPIDDT